MQRLQVPCGGETLEVEQCGQCGGLYLDFFDGEISRVARALVRCIDQVPSLPPPTHTMQCPDCDLPFSEEPYLKTWRFLRRCPGCLSAFLFPDELRVMARAAVGDQG